MHFMAAVALSILIALAGLAPPQEEPGRPADAVIALIAWWQPGEIRYVEVVKGKRQIVNDTTSSEEQMRILYSVQVLEETDTSYTLRWDILEVEDDDEDDFEISDELLARLEDEGIRIRTTELGMWVGIENSELLAQALVEGIRASEMFTDNPETSDEVLDVITTPAAIEEFIFPELALFYSLHGYEFPIENGWEYTELLPHHFGGSPILAKGYSEISELNEDDGYFTLENTLSVDDHEMRQMTASLLGADFIGEMDSQQMTMSMVDRNVYHVDFFTGWTQKIDRTRTTIVDWTEDGRDFVMRTEEFIHLRLVDAPEAL
jgi:hypothetical protein